MCPFTVMLVIRTSCYVKPTVISFPTTANDTVFQISSTAKETDQKVIRHALHCIKVGYSPIEIQSIDSDVLILLLAYIAMELVSNNDSFNLYLKLVTPNPTWYSIVIHRAFNY